jgi:hypothetical protein
LVKKKKKGILFVIKQQNDCDEQYFLNIFKETVCSGERERGEREIEKILLKTHMSKMHFEILYGTQKVWP